MPETTTTTTTETRGSNSEPPDVKVIAARGHWVQTILQTVFAQVIEITIVIGATHALEMGKLSAEFWAGACCFSATGGMVSKMRGKPIVPTVAAIGLWLSKAGTLTAAVRHLLMPALAISLVAAPAGCAPFFAALPTIIAAASTASDVITEIEHFVSTRVHDPSVDVAITKARAALAAVREAAAGAKDIHDRDFVAALEAWDKAYRELLVVTGPLGVHAPPEGGRLAAPGPNELVVPSAPVLRLSMEGRS